MAKINQVYFAIHKSMRVVLCNWQWLHFSCAKVYFSGIQHLIDLKKVCVLHIFLQILFQEFILSLMGHIQGLLTVDVQSPWQHKSSSDGPYFPCQSKLFHNIYFEFRLMTCIPHFILVPLCLFKSCSNCSRSSWSMTCQTIKNH